VEDFRTRVEAVAEAWLGGDKWAPEFLYGSSGPEAPIRGGMVNINSRAEFMELVRRQIRKHDFFAVGVLGNAKLTEFDHSLQGKRAEPRILRGFFSAIFTRDRQTLLKVWKIQLDGEGHVQSYAPFEGRTLPIVFRAEEFFPEGQN